MCLKTGKHEPFKDAIGAFDCGHVLIKAFKQQYGISYRNIIKQALGHMHHLTVPRKYKLVIIESPYAGAVNRNMEYLQKCIKDCLVRGESPYASHLMLTTALDDTKPDERTMGIEAGLQWSGVCDLVAVYRDYGVSRGMMAAIDHHKAHGRILEYRNIL